MQPCGDPVLLPASLAESNLADPVELEAFERAVLSNLATNARLQRCAMRRHGALIDYVRALELAPVNTPRVPVAVPGQPPR